MTTESTASSIQQLPSSFRDPAGFMFQRDGIFYRQVNISFKENFEHFINSGCYEHLKKNKLLLAHEEMQKEFDGGNEVYKILKPEQLRHISYAYEWCFDMMKDAALLTLRIAEECLQFGMMLRDATPYNIQWYNGSLIWIDSLSFEKYDSSKPWIAYRQFCESFLSPLLLMHYHRQPLQPLLQGYPDGIPLPVVSALLPFRSRLSLPVALHIHLHSKYAGRKRPDDEKKFFFSEKKLRNILSSLKSLVQSLNWRGKETNWGNYYDEASQREGYLGQKEKIITEWLNELRGVKTAVDLGANEGRFSLLLAKQNIGTIAADSDHTAINALYRKIKEIKPANVLPLLIDLSHPSPALGLNNEERPAFLERSKADLCLALALIHHLAIGKNIPFLLISKMLANLSPWLIIEFVPKEDEKVMEMLRQKKDIYVNYTEQSFITGFEKYFSIEKKHSIPGTGRTIYLMKRNG
jgi:hypothetical protein